MFELYCWQSSMFDLDILRIRSIDKNCSTLLLAYFFLLVSSCNTVLIFNLQEELSVSGTGTVVVRSPRGSPRGIQSTSLFSDQSSLVLSAFLPKFLYTHLPKIFLAYLPLTTGVNSLCSPVAHLLLLRMLLPVAL